MIHTTASTDGLAQAEEYQGRSLWQDALARLLRNKAAVVSMVVLGVIAFLALFAPLLSPHPYDEIYWERILAPPDLERVARQFSTQDVDALAVGPYLQERVVTGAEMRHRVTYDLELVLFRDFDADLRRDCLQAA